MANLIFQRATWSLSISRSSRTFSLSFSTALPRRATTTPSRHSHGRTVPPTPSSHRASHRAATARRAFSTAKAFRAYDSSAVTPSSDQASTSAPLPIANDLSSGFEDQPLILDESERQVDWTRSFHGLSAAPFSPEASAVLLAELVESDIEIKPDGILYLPEIKYRRILNRAFGPGAWGLAPRGETIVTAKSVTREYALVVLGRLVSVARGEQDYFSPEGIATASEGCKSNALVRCCKDLGIASELWDPRFTRDFMAKHVREVFVEHVVTKRTRKIYLRKDDKVPYPYKEKKAFGAATTAT